MNYDPINTLVTLGTGAGLYSLLKNVLPAYFTEKGKNLATREDIGRITEEVEKVKDVFTAKADQFRADLQYFNQVRFSVKNEERNAIISCYEKYNLWITLLTNIGFGGYSGINADNVLKKVEELNDAYFQVILSESKMNLYVGYNEFSQSFTDLKKLAFTLQTFVTNCLYNYYNLTVQVKIRQERIEKGDSEASLKLINDIHKESMSIAKEYREGMHSQYEMINIQLVQWQRNSLYRITTLDSGVSSV
jgi:hypothetical protein